MSTVVDRVIGRRPPIVGYEAKPDLKNQPDLPIAQIPDRAPKSHTAVTIRNVVREPMLVVDVGPTYENETRYVKFASKTDGVVRYRTTSRTSSFPFQKGAYVMVTGDLRFSPGQEQYVRLARASFEDLK